MTALVLGWRRPGAWESSPTGSTVNAFDPVVSRVYLDAGATFAPVGADLAMLARTSEARPPGALAGPPIPAQGEQHAPGRAAPAGRGHTGP
ncbi:hypothetical protein GCM10009790_04730 [Georgenia ruanii]